MSRYYFHLMDSVDQLLDPEGIEMPAGAVAYAALTQVRDCIAGDVKHGKIDLHYRIDVHDEDGKVIHTLPFEDAVEMVCAR